jgi:serine/threonine protein kinase
MSNKMKKLEKIGEGTYGFVYTAKDDNEKEYAVKRNIIDKCVDFTGSIKEFDLLNRFKHHPFIINLVSISYGSPFVEKLSPIKDRFYKDDKISFVFEKADYDGHSFTYEKKMPYSDYKLSFLQVMLGLEYLHSKNVIHRDLKPSNLLYFEKEKLMKICDFGLAKFNTSQGVNTPRTVTAWYRAPEILCDNDYSFKSDIWSLGCVLFEMIAEDPFLQDCREDEDELIKKIISRLPNRPDGEVLFKLFNGKKYRLNKKSKKVKSWEKLLNFNKDKIKKFNEDNNGTFDKFIDLLNHMLEIDIDKRYDIKQCIDHEFFNNYRNYIDEIRKTYLIEEEKPNITIINCEERKWMKEKAEKIYKNREKYDWYSHRVLFQSIDIFDRFLFWYKQNNLKYEKDEITLRYLVCLYLSHKYFITLVSPTSYKKIVPDKYKQEENLIIAEDFEFTLIKDILNCVIYRETIYESADYYNDKLEEKEVENMLRVYLEVDSVSDIKAKRLYKLIKFAKN